MLTTPVKLLLPENVMRFHLVLTLLVLSSSALFAADKLQPLNVKIGLWEVTHTMSMSGMPPIPAELLAKMTPEQKAQLEERMKARSAEPPHSTTEKQCVTK